MDTHRPVGTIQKVPIAEEPSRAAVSKNGRETPIRAQITQKMKPDLGQRLQSAAKLHPILINIPRDEGSRSMKIGVENRCQIRAPVFIIRPE
jgi:hypothetical protein